MKTPLSERAFDPAQEGTFRRRLADGSEVHESDDIALLFEPNQQYADLVGSLGDFIVKEGMPDGAIEERLPYHELQNHWWKPEETVSDTIRRKLWYIMREQVPVLLTYQNGPEVQGGLVAHVRSLHATVSNERGTKHILPFHADWLDSEDEKPSSDEESRKKDSLITAIGTTPDKARAITVSSLGSEGENLGPRYLSGLFVAPKPTTPVLPASYTDLVRRQSPDSALVSSVAGGTLLRMSVEEDTRKPSIRQQVIDRARGVPSSLPIEVFPENATGLITSNCIHSDQVLGPDSRASARLVVIAELDNVSL